jgi:hypothetical protein
LVSGYTLAFGEISLKKALGSAGWVILWLIGPLVFLFAERGSGLSGFPLDDAWIHQTYARSLADGLGWTYAGGAPSAGSTSPLWTLLQVPAHWAQCSPVIWGYGLGVLLLLANAVLIMLWVRKFDGPASRVAFFFCLGEWHLVWAALSGMETILYCCWIALVFFLFFPIDPRCAAESHFLPRILALGILAGAGIWIRPEAILLSALALLAVILQWRPVPAAKAGWYILGLLAPILLYFAFEYSLSGHLLPNTFFVKTAEYSELTSVSIFFRLLEPWIPLMAGPFAVLILFLPAALVSLVRDRKWIWGLPFLWALAHLVIYAIQLPATYQHGRYFIPILPVLLGYGVYGYSILKKKLDAALATRVFSKALWASAILLTAIFLWTGAMQFVRDVKLIDTEMVAVAIWIRDNTPPDTVVAAHDIGALGYFGERRIIDLGGVTDLSALSLLSKRISLREYLRQKDVDLLMTMPDFYPADLAHCIPILDFPIGASPAETGSHTLLYDWRKGCTE